MRIVDIPPFLTSDIEYIGVEVVSKTAPTYVVRIGVDMEDEKGAQSRGWMLTLPASEYTKEEIVELLSPYAWSEGQREIGGETGYEHYQVWVEHSGPIKFKTLKKKFPKAHLEPRRGTKQQAHDYVSKSETSTGDRFEQGEMPDLEEQQGRRSDLRLAHSAIMQGIPVSRILITMPGMLRYSRSLKDLEEARMEEEFGNKERELDVHYVWGEPGVGKTRMIYDKFEARDIYRVNSYKNPFDGYHSEPVLVLDEFYGQLDMEMMLNVLDRYPLRLPARYNDRIAAFTTVYIVSNVPLTSQYMEIQRRNTAQWKAFLRRITSNERMEQGGVLVPEPIQSEPF